MIASTAPKEIKQPTVSNTPPLAYLQSGGQLGDYRFTSGPYAGMTVGEVRQLMTNHAQQTQQQFGPKKPDTVTGSSSTDQALGYVGGLGVTAGTAYLTQQALAQSAPVVAQTGGQIAGQVGGQVASQGAGQVGGQIAGQGASQVGGQVAGQTGGQVAGQATGQTTGQAIGGSALGQIGGAVAYNGAALYQAQELGRDNYANYSGQSLGNTIKDEGLESLTMGNYGGFDPVNGLVYSTPITAPIPITMAVLGSLFGGNAKFAAERKNRKGARTQFQRAGLMNQDSRSRYNLADGSQYDIRTDPERDAYNIDWKSEDGRRDQDVGLTNALANALVRGGSKVSSDMSGELFNAWRSNGQFDANARASFDKVGGRDAVYQGVADRWLKDKAKGENKYTAAQRDADFASIDRLYGIKNESGARWEDSANLSDKDKQRNAEQLSKANGGKPQTASSVSPQATTKPLPVQAQEVNRNGGRPATPIVNNTKKGKKK